MTVLVVPIRAEQDAAAWQRRCRRGLLAWLADDGLLAVPDDLFDPPTADPITDLGRRILAVLCDPASWQPGLVHDALTRRPRP